MSRAREVIDILNDTDLDKAAASMVGNIKKRSKKKMSKDREAKLKGIFKKSMQKIVKKGQSK